MKRGRKPKNVRIEPISLAGFVAGSDQREIVDKLNEVIEAINGSAPPASNREMTNEDAKRVVFGDLKDLSVAEAARQLDRSYMQVYMVRKGRTFQAVYDEASRAENGPARTGR